MAVQAQYPANFRLLNRGETEKNSKEVEANFAPPLFEQSPVFYSPNGGNVNPRKRGREAAKSSKQQMSVLSLQSPAAILTPAKLGLTQLQSPASPLVSTGLKLTLINDQNQREQQTDSFFFSSSENLAQEINKQKHEIEQFLLTQGERLRREMAEKRNHHYRVMLAAAEKSLSNKLREKEAEIERAARRAAELQDHLARLRAESMAWQAKAMAEQSAAASLHSQLLQAAAAAAPLVADECHGESPAEDAGSAYVDPVRSEKPNRPCWTCRTRPASVVLLPCRHLCVCSACDSSVGPNDGCPACGSFRTGSLQVFFS